MWREKNNNSSNLPTHQSKRKSISKMRELSARFPTPTYFQKTFKSIWKRQCTDLSVFIIGEKIRVSIAIISCLERKNAPTKSGTLYSVKRDLNSNEQYGPPKTTRTNDNIDFIHQMVQLTVYYYKLTNDFGLF